MKMRHKGCGGLIIESDKKLYEYEREDGSIELHRMQVCSKCGMEILGDMDLLILRDDVKIISGGQSGADLGGIEFALKYGYEREVNTYVDFKPLFGEKIPDGVKVNIVSNQRGVKGLKERTEYNVKNSDATLIFVNKPISKTKSSRLTMLDAIKHEKPYLIVDTTKDYSVYEVIGFLDDVEPKILNIAGQRDLSKTLVVLMLEKCFEIEM